MVKNKLWFCGMSGPNSLEDLKELLLPIYQFFDGVVWVLHDSIGAPEEEFLKTIIKNGKIIHYYYSGRHDISRNQYLWCGPIRRGDWILTSDLLERPNIDFVKNIPNFIDNLKKYNLNAIYYYGKPYLFQYHPSVYYCGTPHEGLIGDIKGIEYSNYQSDESKVRLNVRPLKRKDEFNWVSHYAKYFLIFNSNHYLLGWEHKDQNEKEKRNELRLKFLDLMFNRGYDNTIDDLKRMLINIDDEIKYFLNHEKVWSDFYQYEILGNKNVKHTHNIEDIIKI